MLRIGVTGGIGSGKSIVCKVLSELGYPVFHSDDIAKEILVTDPQVRNEITSLFGDEVYENGELNRIKLAQIIFNDGKAREQLNAVVHPRVRQEFDVFAIESRSELVFNEAAILFETGSYRNFDIMVLVTAPEEIRIARVMKRDNVSRDQVIDRIKAQWNDERKAELADYVLVNDNDQPLLVQIEEMLADLVTRPQ